jgi:hypothetical protein
MKKWHEPKLINPEDLVKLRAWPLYCIGKKFNPLMDEYEKADMKKEYYYMKAHPEDIPARKEFIAKRINFSE